ncbi:hypothetical protein [Phocoenobacter skyensis]|uniref:Ribbon-helix-helix protein, copG family n=1 Tax=Phocoenobacter skyensis TaxID=97481 RepID=A0A1H7XEZ9_9PAST|nr:hypothetical protein [Pasteurella skyensis]MDP8079686.1 hypothetical protein [Pasteurella skyensis]MDP8085614.1 hypothetical protein [Pasteurella skyensis]MDP8162198.1 hypothetical protein [Pasteurella skyensis]MDP8170562.1 hypothetical protein [Pasteurella skyensis]MDP8172662.1 hypothetical protein [Pasteurella skyensis]
MIVRKNITLEEQDYNAILAFANKNGLSFSEMLRKTALDFIEKSENMDLLQYMNANLENVSAEEQAEIEALNIDFNDLTGSEMSVKDVL